jgi:predicted metal-dependent phosphoesterase TrpH
MIIDLHSHSTRSDGKESPTEVFEQAALAGVDILALTDHDTTTGWAEASVAATRLGLGFVPGIEVTTVGKPAEGRRISVHLLAYLPNPDSEALHTALGETKVSREVRGRAIVERLATELPITWDMVLEHLEDGATIGRPAIADTLVTMGVVENRSAAFSYYLDSSGPFYVSNDTVEVVDAIELIRLAGGVPIIAHPLTGVNSQTRRHDLPVAHFEHMIEHGLAGFEVYHRDVPEEARTWLLELANKHDLIVTGSSDYHGVHGKPNRLGENSTAPEMLERILAMGTGTEAQL